MSQTTAPTPVTADSLSEYTVRTIGVKRSYKMGTEEVHALRGVDIQINRGEYISIMGPSGSGKSTLFNMIGGLAKPTSGKVYIDQVDIAQLDANEIAWLRCRKIGYIFQTFNLIPVMTAIENVMLPMIFAGMNTADAQDKAAEILKRVELGHRMVNKPSEMSGGQQQRVAIARAFANDPAIILADEPTGNLDQKNSALVFDLLTRLAKDNGQAVVLVTHNPDIANRCDEVRPMRDGEFLAG